ncbi:MAG: guanylate kinase [Acidimicrobiales bacterium]
MILVVMGAGGVGKGTVVARLMELDDRLWLSRSWTTRPRRAGEAPDAYVFVAREDFLRHRDDGGFLEWNEFPANGHLYGTPRVDAPPDRDIVFEIEPHGALQVKAVYPDAVVVLVVAPSAEEQEARLRARGDDDASVRRRVELGRHEETAGRGIADHVVVNDDVDRAARQVLGILDEHRARS